MYMLVILGNIYFPIGMAIYLDSRKVDTTGNTVEKLVKVCFVNLKP